MSNRENSWGTAPLLDVDFNVRYRHRLRLTRDVMGAEQDVLANVLEASETQIPRVQFWLDEAVWLANPQLKQQLSQFAKKYGHRVTVVGNPQIVPGGEAIKNDVHIIERMLKVFNHYDLDRRSYVVVIGGGAVLDAVGFATAITHRGLRLVRIPTTTLAQADSGLGVKNSINLFHKKNWLGTFAVPWAVINDQQILETLSDRDFRCGFSEAVKVALLKDRDFFARICAAAPLIAKRGSEAWPVIAQSAMLHLHHITGSGDAFEMLEARPLDYGHWLAHRLESMSEFELRHGEAVAIGVAIDTVYSHLVHGLPADAVDQALGCLQTLGLLRDHPAIQQTDELFLGLEEFRQHLGGRLTVTMLRDIGSPIDVHEIKDAPMRQAIAIVSERLSNFFDGDFGLDQTLVQ